MRFSGFRDNFCSFSRAVPLLISRFSNNSTVFLSFYPFLRYLRSMGQEDDLSLLALLINKIALIIWQWEMVLRAKRARKWPTTPSNNDVSAQTRYNNVVSAETFTRIVVSAQTRFNNIVSAHAHYRNVVSANPPFRARRSWNIAASRQFEVASLIKYDALGC